MRKLKTESTTDRMVFIKSHLSNSIELAFTKVAMHIKEPTKYPLPTDHKSFEQILKKIYTQFDSSGKNKMIERYAKIPDANNLQTKRKYGNLLNIDLSSKKSIFEQATTLITTDDIQLDASELNSFEKLLQPHLPKGRTKHAATKTLKGTPRGNAPGTLRLSLEKIKCVDTQDVRKDEISIKGFTISSILENEEIEETSLGKFKVAEEKVLNTLIRDFDLREANTFPQTFIAGIFVIERDTKKDDATLERTIDIASQVALAALVAGQLGGLGALAALITKIPPLLVASLVFVIVTLAIAILIEIFGVIVPQLRLSEVSQELQDIFVMDINTLGVGESESNTFNAQLTGTNFLKLKGNYDVTVKWERVD